MFELIPIKTVLITQSLLLLSLTLLACTCLLIIPSPLQHSRKVAKYSFCLSFACFGLAYPAYNLRFFFPELQLLSVALTCSSYLFGSSALLMAVNLRLNLRRYREKAQLLVLFSLCFSTLLSFLAWKGHSEIVRSSILTLVITLILAISLYLYIKQWASLHRGERMIAWMLTGSLLTSLIIAPVCLYLLQSSHPNLMRQIVFGLITVCMIWGFASIYACHLFDAIEKQLSRFSIGYTDRLL